MHSDDISAPVRGLIHKHLRSIDHAEVVLELAEHPERTHSIATLATRFHWTVEVTERVVRDLVESGLVAAQADGYRFVAQNGDAALIAELSSLYHRQPVTLVRAIYSAPLPVAPLVRRPGDELSSPPD